MFFNKIKRKIIRKLLFYYLKRSNLVFLFKLLQKPIFKKEGYWITQQLLNRGYLDYAHEVIQTLPYKKHFSHIIRRIESMIEIRNNGYSIPIVKKSLIKETNILFAVHNSLPYDKSGYAIRTQQIATFLKKKDISIYIATRPGYPWDLQKHRVLAHREMSDLVNGIDYIRLEDKDKTFKKGADIEYINVYADALIKVAKQHNSTILHAHSNYLNGLAAIQAANVLKIPSVYEVRGLWQVTRTTLDDAYRHAGMFEYESIMEKTAVKNADIIVTISESLKKLIISWGVEESKIYLIPNAVDIEYFKPIFPNESLLQKYNLKDKIVLGFIGSLTAYEGLKELIIAVNELIAEGFNLSLIIVGDGREKTNLETLVDSENIIFTGRVPFEQVKEYYSIFDICPFPRNNVEVCRYVPPLKILEAMAMKKAVIVSNLAPLLEIVENGVTGLVCKADDKDSLKHSIVQLYEDILLRKKLGENARKWVEQNRSWNDIGEKYNILYNSFK